MSQLKQVVCKFFVASVGSSHYCKGTKSGESIEMNAVGCEGENKTWATATPSGQLKMWVANPECFGFFVPGKAYKITIEEFDEAGVSK